MRTFTRSGATRRGPAAVLALALAVAQTLAACRTGRPAGSAAGGQPRRTFAVAGDGALEITVPRGWTAEATAEAPGGPTTIRLGRSGVAFVALLTAFQNAGAEAEDDSARADTAHLFAELARRNALAGSVEHEIPLEELVGDGVHGFWFTATDRELVDREPGPEEWRHVVQGAAAVGPLVVAFTLLDNGPGPHRGDLLEMIRRARHLPDAGEPRPAAGLEPDPSARTVPFRIAARGRSWAVLVDLPGFRMFKPRQGDDGVSVLALGQHPGTGIVVSVILRAARGAEDAAGCREADLPRIREAARGLETLRLGSAGPATRAAYRIGAGGGEDVRQEHAHAWLAREGVCANVHVSKIDPDPGDETAMERILDTARFGEDL